jgi:hypothetical protein
MPILELENYEEFVKRTEVKDFEICTYILTAVRRGYTKKYNKVKVFDMIMRTDPFSRYSFSLERSEWKKALNACLEAYAERELYEECSEIKSLLESL